MTVDPTHVAGLLARCTFPPAGTAVACALSGGPDSSALVALAVAAGCTVTAIHVDHGLRPESASEADRARHIAGQLGAAFQARTVQVGRGPNLQARARAARYAALPAGVLTGHTADDQAETVLLNLVRGAGATGLAAMRPGHRRPLLALRRAETVDLCTRLGVEPIDDPSNATPAYARNRIRHEALPVLSDLAGRDVVPLLTRQADLLREDDDLLDELAASIDPHDALALVRAPRALARRAVRRWLADPYPPDAATVERVLAVAAGHAVACETSDGRRVSRTRQRLDVTFTRPSPVPGNAGAR